MSHDRALLDAVPDRIVAVEEHALHSYDGGWADLQAATAARSDQPTPPVPEPAKTERAARSVAPAKPKRRAPSELETLEARIAETEARVGELEGRLAADWSNMDLLTAHRAARDELQGLLSRWEELFDARSV